MIALRKKIGKVVPVWVVLGIVLVGTAAGAFVWISNLVERDETVTDLPIELQDTYMAPLYANRESQWILDYTINEMDHCTGYVWVKIWCGSSITPAEANITGMWVEPTGGSYHPGSLVSGYPQNTASNEVTYLFEDPLIPGPFDFSEYGMSFDGEIWFWLNFTVTGNYNFQVAITSSL